MKSTLFLIVSALILSRLQGQYYYKDIIVPQQAAKQLRAFKHQNVRSVKLDSYESDGQPTEQFQGSQEVGQNFTQITTRLQSALAGSSQLISRFNAAGVLVSTSDTTDGSGSSTQYLYDNAGQLAKVRNVSVSAGSRKETEEHIWTFQKGKPASMLRIKNSSDTTFVRFSLDEKGNVAEENSTRNRTALPAYYYYYDDRNQLTDIASYNIKAKRLLPDYAFDYNEDGSLKTMMVVPEGSSDYQKWYYEYSNGLKSRETVFNKKKQLLGKIEYQYN